MSNSIPLMEQFYTLQGEGRWMGHAAYFVRLAGCDVGCTWCDVKESWDENAHPQITIETIVKKAKQSLAKIVVITGGEPTLHNLETLTSALKKNNLQTHIETSGTNKLTGEWDWVTFSPKRFKKPLEEYFDISNELKIVITHKNDLRWAKDHEAKMNKNCLFYIQPEWGNRKEMEPLCINFVKENPTWHLSLQTHKYLGIE